MIAAKSPVVIGIDQKARIVIASSICTSVAIMVCLAALSQGRSGHAPPRPLESALALGHAAIVAGVIVMLRAVRIRAVLDADTLEVTPHIGRARRVSRVQIAARRPHQQSDRGARQVLVLQSGETLGLPRLLEENARFRAWFDSLPAEIGRTRPVVHNR